MMVDVAISVPVQYDVIVVVRYGSITITVPLPPSDGNTVVVVAAEADGSNEVVVPLG